MSDKVQISDDDLKELLKKVLNMKMDELFQEPYDPPEDLEDLEELD